MNQNISHTEIITKLVDNVLEKNCVVSNSRMWSGFYFCMEERRTERFLHLRLLKLNVVNKTAYMAQTYTHSCCVTFDRRWRISGFQCETLFSPRANFVLFPLTLKIWANGLEQKFRHGTCHFCFISVEINLGRHQTNPQQQTKRASTF